MRKILIVAALLGSQLSYGMQNGPYNDRGPWNGAPGGFGNMNMPGEPMNNLPATLNRPDRNWHKTYTVYDFQDKIKDVTERDKNKQTEKGKEKN